MAVSRPHVLGIDDGPFEKGQPQNVPLVGVTMEGADLVEGVATASFGVDAAGVTDFLCSWVRGLRGFGALQAMTLGGITIAGLAVVDVSRLARELGLPVLVVTRRDPRSSRLSEALRAAGLSDRVPLVAAAPPAQPLESGLFLAVAGTDGATGDRLVRATLRKALLPEPLRLAHLIARAIVTGESRGRA